MSLEKQFEILNKNIPLLISAVNDLTNAIGQLPQIPQELETGDDKPASETLGTPVNTVNQVIEEAPEAANDSDVSNVEEIEAESKEVPVEETGEEAPKELSAVNDILPLLKEIDKKHGRDVAKDMLKKHDATKIGNLKRSNFQAIYDDCKALLEKEAA